ncbi:MAG: hypothetical protein K2H96_11100 [Muribaculaceae bacterium]|nr:hypothetical protein [Muribaculaceae bacterium]
MRNINGLAVLSIVFVLTGIWSCSKKTLQVQTGIVSDELVTVIQNSNAVSEAYLEEEGAVQEPAWTYFERLSIAFDGDSTCIGMKADMDFPEWYSQQQTRRLLREAMERSGTKQDVGFSSREDGTIEVTLTGDSIEAVDKFKSEIFDSPILRFKTVESLEIILL